MSDSELLSGVSGEESPETPELSIDEFLASLGNTGNGLGLPGGVDAGNVALARLFGEGDTSNLFPLDFSSVINRLGMLGDADNLYKRVEPNKYPDDDLLLQNLVIKKILLNVFFDGFDWNKLPAEIPSSPDEIDPTALMDVLGARIDFGRLLDFLPQINITPILGGSAEVEEGDFSNIDFDKII